jgi:hypothetical protein
VLTNSNNNVNKSRITIDKKGINKIITIAIDKAFFVNGRNWPRSILQMKQRETKQDSENRLKSECASILQPASALAAFSCRTKEMQLFQGYHSEELHNSNLEVCS